MSKYSESDLQAMAAMMDFGSTGPVGDKRKPLSGVTSYSPSDQEQFARLMNFDCPNSEHASAYGQKNAPVQPPRHGDLQRTEGSYTADDRQSFERIVRGIEDSSVIKSPSRPRPAALDDGPKYEGRDLEAFAALGGAPVGQVDAPMTKSEVTVVPRYTPPQRPTPKDYFGIKVVDTDAERGRERLYFSAERPAMKIVFSDMSARSGDRVK